MIPNHGDVQRYLKLRRGLGFKLQRDEHYLERFVSFLSVRRASRITSKLAVEFATENPNVNRPTWVQRFCAVRAFAQYWHGFDQETEVPPPGLLRCGKRRARPRICTEQEITRLLNAARRGSKSNIRGLRQATLFAVVGLLAVTGLRVGEALRLETGDVDWNAGMLRIRGTKFGKSRLVPLHQSTLRELKRYVLLRDKLLKSINRSVGATVFTSNRGTPVFCSNLRSAFRALVRKAGLLTNARMAPRLHDLRHRFAIETVRRWYLAGENVEQRLPSLSTYLGHGNVEATYWYLSCTPELRAAVASKLEARWEGVAL